MQYTVGNTTTTIITTTTSPDLKKELLRIAETDIYSPDTLPVALNEQNQSTEGKHYT